jgi:NAD(P)-dependent dehydrogenase (short-subunit alcohol dehydrogenase family)
MMSSDWLQLNGKACIVTGGTGGIGRAIVKELADAGASSLSD